MQRRSFLAVPLLNFQLSQARLDEHVYAYGDGIPHTPADYAKLLTTVSADIEPDDYSRGGIVEKLEAKVAAALGKETAVWLPTGTLANHLAVRLLSGAKRRVLVQDESHLQNDCGDCAETLSGLHLIGLAPGKATFTVEEAERAANDALLGRVVTPVGALQIESPVRRQHGERFDFGQMTKLAAWARSRNIGLHLDGARLFLESAYTKRPVKQYAALFDTVYISMYKYFNAASGAVLAGPKALLGDLYQTRRMFGGGLPQVWPFAAVALHYLDGFEQRFRQAVDTSEQVIAMLSADGHFKIERIPNGTNIFRLRVEDVNAQVYQGRLEEAGISARFPVSNDYFSLQVNETWGRVTPEEIVRRFRKGLG
jgi:threonine aldolase